MGFVYLVSIDIFAVLLLGTHFSGDIAVIKNFFIWK